MWREAAKWWLEYEEQSPLEFSINDAIIEMHQITPTKEIIDDIQQKVCLEWWDKITPHRVSRSAPAHCRQSISNGTICSSSGVEDKRDPIRKTCDSINISYRNDPEQVFPWKSLSSANTAILPPIDTAKLSIVIPLPTAPHHGIRHSQYQSLLCPAIRRSGTKRSIMDHPDIWHSDQCVATAPYSNSLFLSSSTCSSFHQADDHELSQQRLIVSALSRCRGHFWAKHFPSFARRRHDALQAFKVR